MLVVIMPSASYAMTFMTDSSCFHRNFTAFQQTVKSLKRQIFAKCVETAI